MYARYGRSPRSLEYPLHSRPSFKPNDGRPDETPPDDPPTLCDNNGPCGPNEACQDIEGQEICVLQRGFAICEGTGIAPPKPVAAITK